MSEHFIEELRRQLDMAVSKLNAAKLAKIVAERRLHERMCRDSGLIGKKATTVGRSMAIVVHDVDFMSGKPWRVSGFVIKRDGSIGARESTFFSLENLTFSEFHPPLSDEAKLRRSKALDELGALDGEDIG